MTASQPTRSLFAWGCIGVLCLSVIAVRLPVILCSPGAMDEDWFAVPGWTVAKSGIPKIPYMGGEDRQGFTWKADVALLAMPPALHYVQAPFYWILSPTYSTGRLPSLVAALVSIVLLFLIGRRLLQSDLGAVIACALFSMSRAFYFPAITARPDMLCCMWGLGAVLAALRWQSTGMLRWIAVSGLLLGLAGLTHPFAIVIAIQLTIWLLIMSKSWSERLKIVSLLAGLSMAVFSLWLPLIFTYPEIFESQFIGGVLHRSSPAGLSVRTVIDVIAYQFHLLMEHAGLIQMFILATGLVWAIGRVCRFRSKDDLSLIILSGLAIVLLVAIEGRHPTKGYWIYPAAFLFICLARCLLDLGQMISEKSPTLVTLALSFIILLFMIPGAGLRGSAAYVMHSGDLNYDGQAFIQNVLQDLPQDGVFLVDNSYVFDVYASGRATFLAMETPRIFEASKIPFDYLIASRQSLSNGVPQVLNAELIATYGIKEDPFACYVELYRSAPVPMNSAD